MKYFDNAGGAHKYAENSSRKYNEDRYVAKALRGFYVINNIDSMEEIEEIIAHYKNGERIS